MTHMVSCYAVEYLVLFYHNCRRIIPRLRYLGVSGSLMPGIREIEVKETGDMDFYTGSKPLTGK